MCKTLVNSKIRAELGEYAQKGSLHKLRVLGEYLSIHLGAYGVPTSQAIALLWMLFSHEDMEPAQLADAALIPRQTMTSLLDKLERAGYVGRIDHPTDRRRKLVELTEAGAGKASEIWRGIHRYEESVLSVLTKREREEFDRISAKIGDRLRELN